MNAGHGDSARWHRVRRRYLTSGAVATLVVAVLATLVGYAGGGVVAAVVAAAIWLVATAVFMPLFYFRLRKQWNGRARGHS